MRFETTQWSIVLAAGASDASAARSALGILCETYWYPLYTYIRRRGVEPEDARDLTQGFLTSLIERGDVANLHQERGRFRAFLLAALKHYLANDIARRRAQKRGGHAMRLPLEFETAERRYRVEPADTETPETLYERQWALTVLERVLASLRQEWESHGKIAEFDALKACLLGQAPPGRYAAVARELGSSEGAVKVAVHRLRRRFQDRLKTDIAATVAAPDDVDDEIRYLVRALNL